MKIKILCSILNQWCSPSNAEDFDNVGLLVGNSDLECTGILISLDTTLEIVQEATEKKCNLIVSFHPIIFSGLKKLTPHTYVQKTIISAIENKIAIYAIHTALDNHKYGVSHLMAEKIGLQNKRVFIPQKGNLLKLNTYVPAQDLEKVLEAIHNAGAGKIGDYDQCSFVTNGKGSFRGNQESNPSIGKPLEKSSISESQIQVVFHRQYQQQIIKALMDSHPYEEVAYEVYSLENTSSETGMGVIGSFTKPINENTFLQLLRSKFASPIIRHSKLLGQNIKHVVLLGGSGSFAIDYLNPNQVDAFVSADLKYHHFFKAENQMLFCDIGHYESEQFTPHFIHEFLCDKLPNFAVHLSKIATNPVYYF
ncbi:MAG: Nif3-like dinuclear metal center hexameric protein [Flavobacteriaceae bacterium]|nr:Nif3-like dinuclear metal center hexameric protein [Flavobacteriaceae bacterium]MCY4268139.1 Nif3-like dinuclear metal center hexameric protein [Flavobacteriaceae bacterium]